MTEHPSPLGGSRVHIKCRGRLAVALAVLNATNLYGPTSNGDLGIPKLSYLYGPKRENMN